MAVLGGRWSTLCCSCFTHGKDPLPIVQEAGCTLGLIWTTRKISPSQVFSPLPSHPMLLYSHMLVYQLLRGAYCLYLQGRRVEVSVCSAFKIRSFHSSMLKTWVTYSAFITWLRLRLACQWPACTHVSPPLTWADKHIYVNGPVLLGSEWACKTDALAGSSDQACLSAASWSLLWGERGGGGRR
jgi:hypothetical protein